MLYRKWEPDDLNDHFCIFPGGDKMLVCVFLGRVVFQSVCKSGRRMLASSPATLYAEVDYQRHKKLVDVKLPVKIFGTSLPRTVLKTVDVKG